MKISENLKLNLPEESDIIDINILTDNFRKLDKEVNLNSKNRHSHSIAMNEFEGHLFLDGDEASGKLVIRDLKQLLFIGESLITDAGLTFYDKSSATPETTAVTLTYSDAKSLKALTTMFYEPDAEWYDGFTGYDVVTPDGNMADLAVSGLYAEGILSNGTVRVSTDSRIVFVQQNDDGTWDEVSTSSLSFGDFENLQWMSEHWSDIRDLLEKNGYTVL